MAVTLEVDIAVGGFVALVCKNVGSVFPYSTMAVWLIFAILQLVMFSDIYEICVE